jgi:protocatechuate 3,4-dioxygenase beta subunit
MAAALILFLMLQEPPRPMPAPIGGVAGQRVQPPAVDPNLPKSVLRGHVYAADGSGPLRRAAINLRADRRQGETYNATSNAQGAWEIRDVDAGTYTLSCSRNGFVSQTYGQRDQMRPGTPVNVRPGQEIKDLNFKLIRGGVISGAIQDDEGEPVVGAGIQVLARNYRRGMPSVNPIGLATSDDRGQYRVYNLTPGRYYVQATARGFAPMVSGPLGEESLSFAPIYYPNSINLQDAQRVEVRAGAEVPRIDLTLRQVPTYRVLGKVIDSRTGKNVSGGMVQVMPGDLTIRYFNSGGQIRSDGTFRLQGLLPGKYRLMVMTQEEGRNRPMWKPFELGAANIDDLVVTVGGGTTVRGRVVFDGGGLAAGTGVSLMPKADRGAMIGMGGDYRNVNSKDGTFEFTDVQPGEYEIYAQMPRPGGASNDVVPYTREVRLNGEDILERGLTVVENVAVNDVEVIIDARSGVVTGRALNDSGETISGASVVFFPSEPKLREKDRYFKTATADQNGNFTLRGIVPGEYFALIWPESDPWQVLDPDVFGHLEKHVIKVKVERGGSVTQDLKLTTDIKTIAQTFAQ